MIDRRSVLKAMGAAASGPKLLYAAESFNTTTLLFPRDSIDRPIPCRELPRPL
jgi:hypothetical protein